MTELAGSYQWPDNGNGLIFDCNIKREFAVAIFWFEYLIGDDVGRAEFYIEHHNYDVEKRGQRALAYLADRCGVDISTLEYPWEFLEKEVDEACITRIAEIVKDPPARTAKTKARRNTTRRETRLQSVYVIACEDGAAPLCKIGIASSPESRLQQLSTASPHKLRLVGHLPAAKARDIEATAHARFADCRRNGEWFSIAPETALEFITLAAEGRA